MHATYRKWKVHTYIHKNESKHSEMGPVRHNLIQRSVRSVHVCALHCAQLLHTILHRTGLIISPLTLQTITIAPMMSIWGKGGGELVQNKLSSVQLSRSGVNAPLDDANLVTYACVVFDSPVLHSPGPRPWSSSCWKVTCYLPTF